jgi:cytochrome c oxidase subunit 4
MTGLGEDVPLTAGAIWRRSLPVWAALMLLLGATLGLAYVPLGRLAIVAALGIAAVKAGVVLVFFMQLKRPDPLLRLAAGTALVFVAFLLTLTFTDVLTRAAATQPGTVMPRSEAGHAAAGQRAF